MDIAFYPQQQPDPNYEEAQYEQGNATYKGRLIGMWLELGELGTEFQINALKSKVDNELKFEYFSRLRSLWMELEPHVLLDNKGDNVISDDDEAEFKKFEKYVKELSLFETPDNSDDIFGMHRVIGKILRQLSITGLEQ
jgi:phosphatidate phosphatase PAH1